MAATGDSRHVNLTQITPRILKLALTAIRRREERTREKEEVQKSDPDSSVCFCWDLFSLRTNVDQIKISCDFNVCRKFAVKWDCYGKICCAGSD